MGEFKESRLIHIVYCVFDIHIDLEDQRRFSVGQESINWHVIYCTTLLLQL